MIIMKSLFTLTIIAVCAALAGCDSPSKLADQVSGTWTGDMQAIPVGRAGSSSIVERITFQRDSSMAGGIVIISADISSDQPVQSVSGEPVDMISVTAAARSSITGTWRAIDNNGIALDLDMHSINVRIDPEMVELLVNPLTDATRPEVDSVRPEMVNYMHALIARALHDHYLTYSRLDNVEIINNGTDLKIEIDHRNMMFHRDRPAGMTADR